MRKVLLLGLGRWGLNHLRNLRSLPVELYISEVTSERLDPARRLGVPESRLSADYRRFIPEVDAAVVVTPAPSHAPLCQELLEAGKDVFVEKPLAFAAADARRLAELADRKRRILQVGHILRFDPASEWLRHAISTGAFGSVRILRANFSGFKRPREDGGVMFADAVHMVDLFHYLLGQPPARVSGFTQDFLRRGMDDASFVSLEYENSHSVTWATAETNYFLPGKSRELTVVGSEMTAVCDFTEARHKLRTFAHQHVREGTTFKAVHGERQDLESSPEEPLFAELRAFVDSLRTRETPRADGWSGYEAVRVIEAALESAKTGRTVALNSSSHQAG